MSYIYEALKRAEDERQQGAVTVRPAGRPLSFVKRPPWWVWGLLGALIANVALLVALTLSRSPSSAPSAIVAAVPLANEPAKPTSMPAPAPRVEQRAALTTSSVTRVAPPPAAPTAPREPARPTPVAPAAEPGRAPVTDARVPVATPAPVIPPAPRERTATVVTPPSLAPVAVAPAPAVVAPAPAAVAPRPITSDAAPKLILQVLVYSDIPSQRMVFMDGRRYVEGDPIDAETTLERLTPDGAVVNRRGQRFTITDRR
jgi:general secretion pathway protein B